jgi:integrase
MPIQNDTYFQILTEERDIKPSSYKLYLLVLTKYCKLLQTTPTDLIITARKEEAEQIPMELRKIRRDLTKYRKHLQAQDYSPKTIRTNLTIVRSFYGEFDIKLPKIRKKRKTDEILITSEDIPGKDHINKALKHANFKYKAIILLMAESGMGSAEIRSLTINDFLKASEISVKDPFTLYETVDLGELKHSKILTWKIKRIKTDKPYFTFSGPDSYQAISDYLHMRNQKHPITRNQYLFGKNDKPLVKRTFERYFMDLNDKCNFGFQGRQRFFTSHKLRKYFATTLEASRMPHLMIRWLMGHNIDSVTNAYFKPDIDALREEYRRVLPMLSINQVVVHDIHTESMKELKELRKEVKRMERMLNLEKRVTDAEKDIK